MVDVEPEYLDLSAQMASMTPGERARLIVIELDRLVYQLIARGVTDDDNIEVQVSTATQSHSFHSLGQLRTARDEYAKIQRSGRGFVRVPIIKRRHRR